TLRVIGPIWSREEAYATSPYRETRPYEGFSPVIPQNEAGWRIEPPVSEPRVATISRAATAAADPPLEPPGTRAWSQGLTVRPSAEFSVDDPMANSSMFSRPNGMAPAARRRSTTVASYGAM